MMTRRFRGSWLLFLAVLSAAAHARAEEATATPAQTVQVPVDFVRADVRERVRAVLTKPTLHARGPAEAFACRPAVYNWLLDHPDRGVAAWRRLGAKCVEIEDRGGGTFGWSDENGGNVAWDTVYRDTSMHIFYASGKVRPGALLGLAPVEVVVVLQHAQVEEKSGRTVIHHQADFFLHTDSRVIGLATKMLGQSAPKAAEQYIGQMEMFFSALSWYLDQHPEKMESLLAPAAKPTK
jgi:hypothetical protein